MDPVTHGITGALLGKGYFSDRHGRVAIFAATLGAVFPDVDTVADVISHDPLAIIKYHRGITHSFVGLPFFAAILAWLTRWAARRLKMEAPSWSMLTVIYGVGIASHILLDGMTSFGTRMLTPFSQQRVAWDLLFIIDLTFTSIVLLPQVIAWIYSDRAKSRKRATQSSIFFALAAVAGWQVARSVGYPFHVWVLVAAILTLTALIFLPARAAWGHRMKRSAWCQFGTYAMLLYLAACWTAHHMVMQQVKAFAAENHIAVDRMAALPLPPSWLSWGGVIRSGDGVYQSRFDIRHLAPQTFAFTPDSPSDAFLAEAMQLPEVRLYWSFARFPVIRSSAQEGLHIIEFGENRFVNPKRRRPQPFTYIVVFDSGGKVVEEGWEQNGMFMENLTRIPHHAVAP
ncbi:MAG: metal-dependent hydrolase [Candidatus Acidiferrales bacterium]